MSNLTVDDVFRVHAEFGRLDHNMVKAAMGPNWPADWDRRSAIFEQRDCIDCGVNGDCHMNCGPRRTPSLPE